MAKPVGSRCNLACEYCYYSKSSAPNGASADPKRMSDELLELFIRQYIEASEGPEVQVVWHGGEPTLAGLDFFFRAVELQKRYLPSGWSFRNNLQTNGILLDRKWCEFIAREHFDVGLSIDGSSGVHDTYRKDHGGKGSWQNAVAAIKLLKAHGVEPDLLCTVTREAADAPLEVYRALRDLDTGWIQFIPIVRKSGSMPGSTPGSMPGSGVTPDSVSASGYGDFLCAIFDEWAQNDIGRLDVQLFAEAAHVWAGGAAGLCWMAPTCGRAIIVEKDGGVYSCDHYVYPEYRIGDIQSSHLRDLVELPVQNSFGNNKRDLLPFECRTCPWLSVCNGGCPKDRFVKAEGGELNHLCSGLKKFFAHAHPITMRILQLARQTIR